MALIKFNKTPFDPIVKVLDDISSLGLGEIAYSTGSGNIYMGTAQGIKLIGQSRPEKPRGNLAAYISYKNE